MYLQLLGYLVPLHHQSREYSCRQACLNWSNEAQLQWSKTKNSWWLSWERDRVRYRERGPADVEELGVCVVTEERLVVDRCMGSLIYMKWMQCQWMAQRGQFIVYKSFPPPRGHGSLWSQIYWLIILADKQMACTWKSLINRFKRGSTSDTGSFHLVHSTSKISLDPWFW